MLSGRRGKVKTAAPTSREGRLRVAVVFGDGHPDYDLAVAAIIARRADTLLLGPEGVGAPASAGAAETALFAWPRHRQALRSLALVWRLSRRIRRFRADVVHVLSEGQVWLNLLPTLSQTPLAVTLHDVTPHPGDRDTARVPRRLVDAFVRQARGVVVHGEGLRRAAVERLGLPPGRVVAGVHPPLLRYRPIADARGYRKPGDGAFRLLFFGRIYPYKGLEHLIAAEALAAAKVPRLVTAIAGKGDDLAPYRARMADPTRFDVRDRRIGDEETARLFAEADLLILPYVEASQSGVLALAAAFGLPAVASDVGEIGVTVRRTGMGVVVPPADARALADAIVALAHDPAARALLSQRAEAALEDGGALGDGAVWAGCLAAYRAALAGTAPSQSTPSK